MSILLTPNRAIAALLLAVGLFGPACRQESAASGSATPHPAASAAVSAPPAGGVETTDAAARNRRQVGGRPSVIWLGLDGLDWDLLDRLVAEGRMPNWKRLTEKGYSARLTSVMPILSPIVWTTIATGVSPEVHRVLDFQEVDPASGQKLPISGRSRAVPAIWNVASASGETVGVVGWWATHPAEEVTGFFVSDRASPIMFEGMPRTGDAYPSSLAPGVEQILGRDGVVSSAELARFFDVPEGEIQSSRDSHSGLDNPFVALPRIIGSTRVYHRIARDLYDRNLPDLMAVYYEGTDAVGHVFAPYVPPKMSCVSDEDYRRYRRVVDEYYALVDRMLGQWMRRADEDGATLIVNSDHGFKWGAERPCERSSLNPSTAAFWHRLDGVFAAYGARVKPSGTRGAASVMDLAPTVSALMNLPIDSRATGTVLRAAFPDAATPARKDLASSVTVRRVATEALSEKDASEYAKGLRALGYLSGGEPEKLAPSGASASASDRPGVTEGGWNNLGVYLRENTKDLKGAEAAFEKALELRPNYPSPEFNLAVLYRQKDDDRRAVDWLFRSLSSGHADPEGTIVRWATEYRQRGRKAAAAEVLERGRKAFPASEPVARELALLRFQAHDCEGAWNAVSAFEATSQVPDTLNALGLFQTCLGRREAALALFHKSLAIRPDQPAVVQSIRLIENAPPSAN
ncbi:MAG TPA: alkaline phosphatase family protein [Thermoanaerobaculia bacterium]|jgi:predicted AlkP superfamily phosphohydrolase/phosphomutase/Flp pilus assembly protein TadD